jgi:exonuclease III
MAGFLLSTRRGRRVLLVLLILIGLALGGQWLWQNYLRPRHPVGPTVRLATWNLRQFSESRKGIDLQRIAAIIKDNRFDLVAIQEVKKDGEEVDRLLVELGTPWKAARFSDTSGNYERFAFIYNSDHVQEIGTPHFIATTDAVIFDRTPYQDTFRAGNFDFTLVEVHLSYNNMQRRRDEAEALARFAKRLAQTGSERDVIVCGDFNEEPPHDNLHFFTDEGWESLNHDPTNLGGTQVYDTFLIDPIATKEWSGIAGSVHFDEQLFGNDDKRAEVEVSDHRPAYADFVTNLPDDD